MLCVIKPIKEENAEMSSQSNNNVKRNVGYLVVLFIILTAIYIVDEISSNITTTMQPEVILDLFKIPGGSVLSEEYESAVGLFTAFSMVSYIFMLIAPFYKALADKFGRKPFVLILHSELDIENKLSDLFKNMHISYKFKSRNYTNKGYDYAIEFTTKDINELKEKLVEMKVSKYSIIEYDADDIV